MICQMFRSSCGILLCIPPVHVQLKLRRLVAVAIYLSSRMGNIWDSFQESSAFCPVQYKWYASRISPQMRCFCIAKFLFCRVCGYLTLYTPQESRAQHILPEEGTRQQITLTISARETLSGLKIMFLGQCMRYWMVLTQLLDYHFDHIASDRRVSLVGWKIKSNVW